MSRPVISYDDITLPYDQPTQSSNPPQSSTRPSKKRKWNNSKGKGKQHQHQNHAQHWDDPALLGTSMNYGGASSSKQAEEEVYEGEMEEEDDDDEEEEEEGSRRLTHQEVWDDSALINAWDAAMEEYEAYNGPDKGWKKEPVNKSPLWYNIPTKNTTRKPASKKIKLEASTPVPTGEVEADSQPINFDTFVPSHDASLPGTVLAMENYAFTEAPAGQVSQDEAFAHALNATYWAGYWTAMYHAQRTVGTEMTASAGKEEGEEVEENEVDAQMNGFEEEEEFVSTQR
ncbi:hypothetical protein BDQ12DRAFT_735316 [Crucibulum laeve]|uniref:Survival Motor Neuron Gemin2-binding domain-containing protein n=1 Tax=Crucibulum laeve TaxID=68775 RepID=A0A5C3M2R4_9AGAR|nr:hypothetical protein BDQ12DRAFT_735316 [Crucibulum laeve]